MRVYLPATFSMLAELERESVISCPGGWAFAVTDALREFYSAGGDEEELSEAAFDQAALASLRLLAAGAVERHPHRRVVISADVADAAISVSPEQGEAVVRLDPAEISVEHVAAIHVDIAEAEEATAKAVELIDAADLGDEDAELAVGDAQDNWLAYYAPEELGALVELL
ncbi:hypothetical protein CATYP_02800 [Corynebacterium atypicum]|uniref:Uncharacterized protein n=1 Tax=Corynebacterium atypicum TaxID=191610 RepID=A0ABM5QM17_9CORY|nr:hypothetical protein [Corynebacterium atypicum]AIG63788.1 hypothetical protein CATYP_02800 [Corynebacterium atypicum]